MVQVQNESPRDEQLSDQCQNCHRLFSEPQVNYSSLEWPSAYLPIRVHMAGSA